MWNNIPENLDISKYVGFVYLIENKSNNRFYIGQKKFWENRTLPPLKGKSKKRKTKKESKWKEYTGSSESLNKDIENGDKIEKKIIHLCETKWEMNFLEALEQIKRNVLLDDTSYNGIINIRLGKCPIAVKEKYKDTNILNL